MSKARVQAGAVPATRLDPRVHRALLWCGVISSAYYVALCALVPMGWEGYSSASRVVSELSAIGAPTRGVWVPLGIVYGALVTAFGIGVFLDAARPRQRVVGALILAYGAISLAPWPPMHQREVLAAGGGTLTDTLHIVWSMVAVGLMLLVIGIGSTLRGPAFRWYSIATLVLLVVFGAVTAAGAGDLEANRPTPWIGVWERIDIGVFLLWMSVLGATLTRGARRSSTE